MDCGPACLWMVAAYYGVRHPYNDLMEKCSFSKNGVSLLALSNAAEKIGFKTLMAEVRLRGLISNFTGPFIAHWRRRHFVVVYEVTRHYILLADPSHGKRKITHEEFLEAWSTSRTEGKGAVLFLEPADQAMSGECSVNKKVHSFKKLIDLLKPHRRQVGWVFLSILLISLIQLTLPFLARFIIDKGIDRSDLNMVLLILFAQFTLFLSRCFADFNRSLTMVKLGGVVGLVLASKYVEKLLRLPMFFFEKRKMGDLMQRLRDNERVSAFLTGSLLSVIFSLVSFIAFSVTLIYYNALVFLTFLAGTALYVVWIIRFMEQRKELDFQLFDQQSVHQNKFLDMFNGIQEIKANNLEESKRRDWTSTQETILKLNIRGLIVTQYQQQGAQFINHITGLIVTYFCARAVIGGDMTLGTLFAVQYIIGQLNTPVAEIVSFLRFLQDTGISVERLNEIEEEKDESTNERYGVVLQKTEDIELDKVSFSYPGSTLPVLNNVNAVIPAGKITAIVGASGGGKTTLLKLLLGIYLPSGGCIRVAGLPLSKLNLKKWRSGCGIVMQDGHIFSDTLAANITLDEAEITPERLQRALKIANLEEFVDSLPLGVDTTIGAEGAGLSQGQRQRVLLARAVYKNPSLLILDEATNALDTGNERVILDNLRSFLNGRTTVVVAHRLSTIVNADQILVVKEQRVVESGTHIELIGRNGYYRWLVESQLKLDDTNSDVTYENL